MTNLQPGALIVLRDQPDQRRWWEHLLRRPRRTADGVYRVAYSYRP